MNKAFLEDRRLSAFEAVKYACLGVPILLKFAKVDWGNIKPPKFPLFFSILGLLLPAMLAWFLGIFRLKLYEYEDCLSELASYAFFMLAGLGGVACFLVATNILIFGWLLLLLIISRRAVKNVNIVLGAQRITYFSAFYQALFVFVACAALSVEYLTESLTIQTIIYVVTIIAAVFRVLAVFQGTFRELNKNILISLLSCLACIDVWWGLYLIFLTQRVIT